MRFTTVLPILLGASSTLVAAFTVPGFEGVKIPIVSDTVNAGKQIGKAIFGGGQQQGGGGGGGGGGQQQGQMGYCNHGWGDDGTCATNELNAYCCAQQKTGQLTIQRELWIPSKNAEGGTGCRDGGIVVCA